MTPEWNPLITPEKDDAKRCLEIRKRSKSGGITSCPEMKFCEEMNRKYPDWYTQTEEEVFNDTVPFGSFVRYKDRSGDPP